MKNQFLFFRKHMENDEDTQRQPQMVNNQYNSPINLYSQENIESLRRQAMNEKNQKSQLIGLQTQNQIRKEGNSLFNI